MKRLTQLTACLLLLCPKALYAQFVNSKLELLRPIERIADSLLRAPEMNISAKDVSKQLQVLSFQPNMIEALSRHRPIKKIAPKTLYQNAQPATAFVAICSRNNPLRPVKITPASAFAISQNGLVVTNYHVLLAYTQVSDTLTNTVFLVRMGNGAIFPLKKILAVSANDDIALIQVDTKGKKVPYLELSAQDPIIGENIYVISNPDGLPFQFTNGMVSNKYQMDMLLPDGSGVAKRNLISITADFGVGSSGAAVLNEHGKVVAVVSSTQVIEQFNMGRPQTQMVIKNTIPVSSIHKLLQNNNH